ncbi:isopentenyl-diphosphate Delta-isomerase [Pedobacter frigoris]|uniref:Isopentenyl-diphosphate delta-isomerase n=1 Tax=Pedobacter frigoris TaxID=2571272 RepID=A0A4U1CPZ5_9SPHI|nr:isopentenyl-diphosphate Delta-isomerase [Pedobacter frigoris]TKC09583.1 isopentenyl-diphosphate Delta-isomerase [Pedobacter frigoris]
MTEHVILVDVKDKEIGTMPKLEAHLEGKLHRAFSIFIFNADGELLLQQRAFDKYHSGGKWTNSCCSHPRPGEATIDAANRRLIEEMGMTAELRHVFSFTYRADLMDGISEYEFDHVFFGISEELPVINVEEVAEYKYMGMEALSEELDTYPEKYTAWLRICFARVMDNYEQIF